MLQIFDVEEELNELEVTKDDEEKEVVMGMVFLNFK